MDIVKRKNFGASVLAAVGPKDKENRTSADILKGKKNVVKKSAKGFLKNNKNNIDMINQINNMTSAQTLKKKDITAEDLTTTGNPGEAYWEQLSESRRVALEATWKENAQLHSKVMELEYENTRLKSMLAEAKTSITLLTELLGENESGDEDDLDDIPEDEGDPDSTLEDASFTSI